MSEAQPEIGTEHIELDAALVVHEGLEQLYESVVDYECNAFPQRL
jgi:hypothetical protein